MSKLHGRFPSEKIFRLPFLFDLSVFVIQRFRVFSFWLLGTSGCFPTISFPLAFFCTVEFQFLYTSHELPLPWDLLQKDYPSVVPGSPSFLRIILTLFFIGISWSSNGYPEVRYCSQPELIFFRSAFFLVDLWSISDFPFAWFPHLKVFSLFLERVRFSRATLSVLRMYDN